MDCYSEEEFAGILCTLDERLNFPLQATALGALVKVIGLNVVAVTSDAASSLRSEDHEYLMSLAGFEFVDPDSASVEWLAVYRYWLE